MEKQTQIPYLLFGLAIITAILHNYLSAVLAFEEPFFFTITLLLILGFAVSVAYNIYTYATKGRPKDIWKLGWLGLVGLLGILPQFSVGLYGFYGFFAFFALKKK